MRKLSAARKSEGQSLSVPELADCLRPIFHKLTRHLRREAISAGFSSVDAFVLGLIKLYPGIGVSRLAEMENTTRPSMSGHIKRLRDAGWITADGSASDDLRRSNLILTTAGHKALATVRQRSNDWLAQQISSLSEGDRLALAAALPALQGLIRRR